MPNHMCDKNIDLPFSLSSKRLTATDIKLYFHTQNLAQIYLKPCHIFRTSNYLIYFNLVIFLQNTFVMILLIASYVLCI